MYYRARAVQYVQNNKTATVQISLTALIFFDSTATVPGKYYYCCVLLIVSLNEEIYRSMYFYGL
jgi:hypothetical protein